MKEVLQIFLQWYLAAMVLPTINGNTMTLLMDGKTSAGETGASFTTSVLPVGNYEYRLTISQDEGCAAISSSVNIVINADPSVTVTASDLEVCEGGTVLLTANVVGGAGTSVYQWQYNDPGTGWENVGTNSSTYTTPALGLGTNEYRVIVTQNPGCEVTSAPVSINVVSGPSVSVAVDQTSICEGGTALFTATVTGGTGTNNYQWQAFSGGTWNDIAGATSSTYSIALLNAGTFDYRVVVSQDAGCNVTSATATVTVVEDPVVTVTADDLDICAGGTAMFSATVTGGAGTTLYQWQFNNGGTWEDISGATSSTYSIALLNTGTYEYRVNVSQNSGCQTTSDPVSVTVVDDPTVSLSADDLDICEGGSSTITASVSGGSGISTYQWQFNNSGTWQNISGSYSGKLYCHSCNCRRISVPRTGRAGRRLLCNQCTNYNNSCGRSSGHNHCIIDADL